MPIYCVVCLGGSSTYNGKYACVAPQQTALYLGLSRRPEECFLDNGNDSNPPTVDCLDTYLRLQGLYQGKEV